MLENESIIKGTISIAWNRMKAYCRQQQTKDLSNLAKLWDLAKPEWAQGKRLFNGLAVQPNSLTLVSGRLAQLCLHKNGHLRRNPWLSHHYHSELHAVTNLPDNLPQYPIEGDFVDRVHPTNSIQKFGQRYGHGSSSSVKRIRTLLVACSHPWDRSLFFSLFYTETLCDITLLWASFKHATGLDSISGPESFDFFLRTLVCGACLAESICWSKFQPNLLSRSPQFSFWLDYKSYPQWNWTGKKKKKFSLFGSNLSDCQVRHSSLQFHDSFSRIIFRWVIIKCFWFSCCGQRFLLLLRSFVICKTRVGKKLSIFSSSRHAAEQRKGRGNKT